MILRHTFSKDSLEGLHFDLLLEDSDSCRTWRLSNIPLVNGPFVKAVPLSPHNIYCLDREEAAVSGGRGWAKRIVGGTFSGSLPLHKKDQVVIEIKSSSLSGRLELSQNGCHISCSS